LPVSDFTITNRPAFIANVRVRRARGEGGKYVGTALLNPHIARRAQLPGSTAAPGTLRLSNGTPVRLL